jgi:hypothetical protein
MQSLRSKCLCIVLGLALPLAAQKPPSPSVDDDFIQKQFGSTCKLMPGPPQLKADLDGDGIEDLVVAGRCSNPLMDQTEDNFTVIKLTVKKKTIMAIYAEETGGDRTTSAVFWDGKKYKYRPMGSSME